MSPLVLIATASIFALVFYAVLNALDLRSLKGSVRLTPEQSILLHRLGWAERSAELKEIIAFHYQTLHSRIALLITMAPSVGLFYTVVGLIAVMIKQPETLDHGQMLADMGVALGSTAGSTLIMISQLSLMQRLLRAQNDDYLREKQLITRDPSEIVRRQHIRRKSNPQLTCDPTEEQHS